MQTARTSHKTASLMIIGFAVSLSVIGSSVVRFTSAVVDLLLAAVLVPALFLLLLPLLFDLPFPAVLLLLLEAAGCLPAAVVFFTVLDAK